MHHLFLIRKSECKRLNVIFKEIIPSIDQGVITKDVANIKDILEIHLPKLRDKALKLADKCIKDDGCGPDCVYCDKEFIENYFDVMIEEMKQ